MNLKQVLILLLIVATLFSCSKEKNKNQIVVGIPNDIETLNPLYAFSVEEGNIAELLYLSLVESNWNKELGEISYSPMLASKWVWDKKDNSILIEIKNNVFWSDGVKCSVDDIIFSFDIYSDPKVQSRFMGYFENFHTDTKGYIDLSKTFEKISNNSLKIKFRKNSNPQLIDIDYPILPKHFFSNFKREEIPTLQVESYISNGAFIVDRWEKEGAIILSKNPKSFLVKNNTVEKIIFKVIPEYQNRINQLITGDIDLMELIKPDDIKELSSNSFINVVPISGREFDYIGWNNISPIDYLEDKKIKPNKFFASPKVRAALTYALERELVVEEGLKGFGQIADGPISPMFNLFDAKKIKQHKFNSEKAKRILKEEGWSDSNNNGIIDKDGIEFAFKMHIPAGSSRREFAASLFKNNLRAIGIDVTIELDEIGAFINNLDTKGYDSWMSGWGVPIPINLKISWFSKLDETRLNYSSYQNLEVDSLFNKLAEELSATEKKEIYQNLQIIINKEQPYSFLYWVDNISAYNKRLKNISITPIGTVHNCWNWTLDISKYE